MIVGTLEIQLLANLARIQADMDAAKNYVGNAMKSIETFVGYAKAALVSFIGIASVNAFKGMVQGSIEATAGLHDMAMQTGASVAALAAFRSVASTSETSIDGIAGAMNKMSKAMAGADEDSKGVGQAVKAIGLNFNDLRNMKPDEQMLAVAKALDGFQDGAGKSAVAMTLFGKEGAKMLPFLKDLADESDAVAAKMTEQQVAAKAAQAAMADDYADNLVRLQKASEGWRKDVSMALLPALFEASQAFRDVTSGAGGVKDGISKLSADGSITNWARMAITGVTYVMDVFEGLKAVVTSVGHVIGGYAALIGEQWGATGTVIAKIIKGDFAGATSEVAASFERQKSIVKDLGTTLDATWGAQTFGSKLRDRMEQLQGVAAVAKVAKENLKFEASGDSSKKDAAEKVSDYQKLTRVIAEKQIADSLQLATGNLLTESDKIRAKMQADLSTGSIKLTASEIALTEAGLKKLAATELQIAAEKFYAEQGKKRYEASSALIKTAVDEAEKNEILARTFGMTREAIEQSEIAALEAQLTQKTTIGLCTAETAELEALIDAKKRNSVAVASVDRQKAEADAAKKATEEWQKGWEETDKLGRDTFVELGMKGAEMAKQVGDALEKALWSALYEVTLRPIAFQIYAGVTGGAGGSGSMSGLMGDAGAASSLFSEGGSLAGIGAMAGEFGAGLANGFASTMAGASVSGTVGVAAEVGGAAGAGLGIGAAMPYIAAAAVAYSLLTQDHGTPTATTGDANVSFSGAGDVTGRKTSADYFWGGSMTKAADDFVVGLNKTYLDTAKNLGIAAVDTYFSYSGNTGENGAAPNFAIRSSAGNQTYSSGETALSDAAVGLAASRAVFNALQKSDLPKYLAGAFDGMTASSMTQEQIAASMAGATALKQFHDQLQALPFVALKDLSFQATQNLAGFAGGLDKLGANLGTYYDKFYTSEEKTAQLTKNTSAAFESLGLVMPALDASTRASYRALVDELAAKDLSVAANARAYSGALTLASAVDQLAPALLDTAKASADAAKIASDAASAASKAAADALGTLLQGWSDSARSSVAESLSAITDSVAAQKTAITDAYSFQADKINASLSTVGTSISKLQSLSSSLKSTLDGMRIAGSDAAYRADAQAQIRAALATARSGGGLPVDGALTSALATISKPSDQLYGNFVDYARDFYSTANDIAALGDLTGQQLTADEVTQKLLTTQNATLKSGFDAEVKRLDALVSEAKLQADAVMKSAGATLSMADALARFTSTLGATLTNSMATAFDKYDANNSSGIDWVEFKQSFGGLASEATLKTLFKAADYNGDGHISQLEAIKANTANLLAVMSVSGAGGALSGAKTFTGTEVAGAIKALADSGATTAQIINAANANFGVTSASLAQVATVTGNTGITDYQKRVDATTPIPASEMASLMQAVNADAAARGVSAEESLYIWAKANGYNAGMVDKKMGWGNGAANAWATSHGYPAFAGGGDHFGGIRLVGENGPELEATGPSRIFNAAQTRSMLQSGGANSSEVVAELRLMADRLEARMEKIEANTRATAGHTAGTDRKLARVIPGNAVIIQAATA